MKETFFIAALIFSNLVYGQKISANKNYKADAYQTIAITPYFDELGNPNKKFNELFEETFSSTFNVCCQRKLEHNLRDHATFYELAMSTIYVDLSEVVRTKSNLFNSLNEAERIDLQNGFSNTDLIIISSSIDSRTVTKINGSGNISVSGNITVFDLRTGEYIAFVADEIKKKFDNMALANPPLDELVHSLLTGLNEALIN
jgi:hypothetical protein